MIVKKMWVNILTGMLMPNCSQMMIMLQGTLLTTHTLSKHIQYGCLSPQLPMVLITLNGWDLCLDKLLMYPPLILAQTHLDSNIKTSIQRLRSLRIAL